ncbi:MAG TPA: hypothetical protein VMP03_05675, partial [Methylomirabilota bacterium]|nr:hypothetical protein [Methylomirabilota bacterium]
MVLAIIWAGYIVALGVLPWLAPTDRSLPNVAAQVGYHSAVAGVAVGAWTIAVLVGLAVHAWRKGPSITPVDRGRPADPAGGHQAGRTDTAAWLWLERGVVAAVVALLYWPAFLARYGHYIEDVYFLNVLLRVTCGDIPYRDFEFLYGPLMIAPAILWTGAFGYSLVSYYSLVAIAEVSLAVVILWVFQRHVADWRHRWLGFLVFAPFVFDTLLGLNYTGWRAMPAVLAIMVVAARPQGRRAGVFAGLLVGLQLGYSYEFGLAGLATMGLMYVLLGVGNPPRTAGLAFGLAALIVGAGVTGAATGGAAGDYVQSTLEVLGSASRDGLGNLPFHWTLNSLALFALLSVAVVMVGRGLPRIRTPHTTYGD